MAKPGWPVDRRTREKCRAHPFSFDVFYPDGSKFTNVTVDACTAPAARREVVRELDNDDEAPGAYKLHQVPYRGR